MMKGKVVLVPFPFDDLSATKVRPAVCLTEAIGGHDQVIVAFISSVSPSPLLKSDLLIAQSHPDFRATGLHVTSVVRLHRMMTISTAMIKRELGELSQPLWQEVVQRLRDLFAL
jgi:mRNA interferase MazF